MLKNFFMATIFSMQFFYQGDSHYVLISTKHPDGKPQYRITIMNGELEKLLTGSNVIHEINGKLLLDDCGGNQLKMELKKQIIKALAEYLNKEIIVTYSVKNWIFYREEQE